MIDQFGRTIDYMRISITDRCNLRCRYCMPEGVKFLDHREILRYEELLEIAQIGKECHSHCEIFKKMRDCIMPREGVFARVLEPGTICVGDEMTLQPRRTPRPWQAAVITLSDRGAAGQREDESGPAIVRRLEEAGYEVVERPLITDDPELLKRHLIRLADQRQLDLILSRCRGKE